MNEIWKPIITDIHYSETFEISNKGRVRRKKDQYIMKTNIDKHGYERLTLNYKGKSKTFKIHILVADSFLTRNENSQVVNHKDGIKTNNNLENLEFTTYSYNNSHVIKMNLKKIKGINNPANKYSEETIRKICIFINENKTNMDIVPLVFGNDLSKKEITRYRKMISQIRTKSRWSVISDEYF